MTWRNLETWHYPTWSNIIIQQKTTPIQHSPTHLDIRTAFWSWVSCSRSSTVRISCLMQRRDQRIRTRSPGSQWWGVTPVVMASVMVIKPRLPLCYPLFISELLLENHYIKEGVCCREITLSLSLSIYLKKRGKIIIEPDWQVSTCCQQCHWYHWSIYGTNQWGSGCFFLWKMAHL